MILGEEILPIGLKAVTSTVCEIRYGEQKKMFIFYKDKEKEVQEMIIDESRKTTAQLKEFLQQENDRDKGSPVEKCELYWPHEILKVSNQRCKAPFQESCKFSRPKSSNFTFLSALV